MGKLILINTGGQEHRVAIVSDEELYEYFIERENEKTIVGNIYKARIDSIAQSLNAAFVDIGQPKKGFLYLSHAGHGSSFSDEYLDEAEIPQKKEEKFFVNQEVLVQVVKEQAGTKGPRLTTKISLPGRYLVLLPFGRGIGISRRIEDDAERKRLRELLISLNLPPEYGFVVRTVSINAGKKQLSRDAKFLIRLWQNISKVTSRSKAPALVHEEYDLIMRTVRDSFTDDVRELVIDSKRFFHIIRKFVHIYSPNLLKHVKLYKGREPLFEHFKVEEKVDSLYERKVKFKSGGYIYVEPTEGLVAIDVNSGKFKGARYSSPSQAQEEMAYAVNMEAAAEIVRQLKLRDLGGLIVIDFIDMAKDSHRKNLLNHFKNLLRNDRAKTEVIRLSDFCILEMTRQKQRPNVENLAFQTCPYCQGTGRVKSVSTVAIVCLRKLGHALPIMKKHKILVSLHPEVVEHISANFKDTLEKLEKQFKVNIILNPSPHFHLEKIIIE